MGSSFLERIKMFTGIITDVGEIARIKKIKNIQEKIFCSYDVSEMELGASICCDGVCLTVTDFGTEETRNWFLVDVSSETVSKNNRRYKFRVEAW